MNVSAMSWPEARAKSVVILENPDAAEGETGVRRDNIEILQLQKQNERLKEALVK